MGIDKIEKLKGRENYDSWKFASKSYLVLKGYWPCVTGSEQDATKNLHAISALGLLLEPHNYSYVQNCTSANEAWDSLENAFEDNGCVRRMDLLKFFTRLNYEDCANMEDYVNKMTNTHQKLHKSGTRIPDDICALIMLSGLPEQYRPMVMAIANCGKELTTDLVRTTLLQEIVQESSSNDNMALFSKKKFLTKKSKFKNKSEIVCFECNGKGHYANKCPSKQKNKLLLVSTYVAKANNSNHWYIDSGASAHMTMSRNNLIDLHQPYVEEVIVGDNGRLTVECAGDVKLDLNDKHKNENLVLKDVLCIPDICANLMSVSQIAKNGKTLIFNSKNCRIFDDNNNLLATARLCNGLYKLDGTHEHITSALIASTDPNLWHRRMGHPCESNLLRIKAAVDGVNFSSNKIINCIVCAKGKKTRNSFKHTGRRAQDCLNLIHTDVCGPMPTASYGGARFLLTFVDDFSGKVFVYPLKRKSDVYKKFVVFKNLIENQQNKKIKILRSDNGREFCNEQLDSFLATNGIIHQHTAPYTPEQNGVAERMNRTLMEKVRCMLIDGNLQKQFWAEAASTAAFLINRTPCRGNDITPEEIWSNIKPDLQSLRVFGCRAMAHIPKENRGKLDPKAVECILLGCSETSKAYKLFDPKNRKIIVSPHVTFFEEEYNHNFNLEITNNKSNTNNCSFYPKRVLGSAARHTLQAVSTDESDSDLSEYEDSEGKHTVMKIDVATSNMVNSVAAEDEFHDSIDHIDNADNKLHSELSEGIADDNSQCDDFDVEVGTSEALAINDTSTKGMLVSLLAMTGDRNEPSTVCEALNGEHGKEWSDAMNAEYNALKENKTWVLTELPPGRKAIDSKWVFKIKRNGAGEIVRYKARLVIKGYSQVKGIDYSETYSPVARYSSIRLLIAMAAKFNLSIHQMDAITAFLQGDLDEEIYMRQPQHFSDDTNKVCRLQNSLYGLKQSSRIWNLKLNNVLTQELGFTRSVNDQCIYFRHSDQNTLVLAVYVDDVIIFGSNMTMISKLKKNLSTYFKMKDIGLAKSILGMNITRNENGSISIDQKAYIADVLERFNMTDCKPVSTPMDANQKLSKDMCAKSNAEKQEMESIPYQELIGCIMYASQISRPDISYAVSTLSRYNTCFGKPHWIALKRVLRYLKGTIDLKLTYTKEDNSNLTGYCDADWAGDQDERRSTTGYIFKLQGGGVSWATRKQPTIALSSTEAEFMSMVAAIQEAIWLKRFELEVYLSASKTLTLYCDNQGAIHLAKNSNYHARTKHIDVKSYFIREKLAEGVIDLQYLQTSEMIADILTKAVNKVQIDKFIEQYGLR